MISLIITNYKTWNLTERCVKSVDSIDKKKQISEIIIVDDCSNEPVPDYLFTHTLVKIISNFKNNGYAKSVNIGFKAAANNICLLLDSDAYIISNIEFISSDFDQNPKLGLLGFKLVDEYGSRTGNGDIEANIWSLILGQKLNSIMKRKIFRNAPIESLYSCAIAVRKLAFEQVEGFDESFDFLDADHDFSMKINRSNWELSINNDVVIFHKGGGSPQLTSKRVIRYYTNRLKLLKKYNLYRHPKFYNFVIQLRLKIELILMRGLMLLKGRSVYLRDKITGRIEVLKIFSKNE